MPTFTHRAGAASPFARGSAVAPAGQPQFEGNLLRNALNQGYIAPVGSGPTDITPGTNPPPPTYTPPPPASDGIMGWWGGLSTVEKAALIGGSVALVGGVGYAVYRARAAKAASGRAPARRRR